MRMRRAAAAAVVLAMAAVTAGCSSDPGTAAVVDGHEISTAELDRVADELGPYLKDASPRAILTAILQSEAWLAVARSHDIEVTDDQGREFLDKLSEGSGADPVEWSHESLVIARVQVASTDLTSATDDLQGEFTAAVADLDVTVNPRYGQYDAETGAVGAADLPWIVSDEPTPAPTAK